MDFEIPKMDSEKMKIEKQSRSKVIPAMIHMFLKVSKDLSCNAFFSRNALISIILSHFERIKDSYKKNACTNLVARLGSL